MNEFGFNNFFDRIIAYRFVYETLSGKVFIFEMFNFFQFFFLFSFSLSSPEIRLKVEIEFTLLNIVD